MAIIEPTRSQVQLLMHLDGNYNNEGVAQISSVTPDATMSFQTGKFGQSAYCSGTNDRGGFTITMQNNIRLNEDFCIDFVCKSAGQNQFGDYLLYTNSNQSTYGGLYIGGTELTNKVYSVSSNMSIWNHVAITRLDYVLKLYINGNNVYSVSNNTVFEFQNIYLDNTWYSNNKPYIDEFRLVNGCCCFTSNFTPPASPYTIPAAPKFKPWLAPQKVL